jgi:hypothetical protein
MRWILVGSLLLMGCGATELTRQGSQVRALPQAPSGCQLLGTIRDAEGGGLRSFASNRAIVQARLRNEAARIGGNIISVVDEERGDTEDGKEHFQTGVAGLTSPNAGCTNCVLLTAQVFQCGGVAPAAPVVAPPQDESCEPKRPAPPPPEEEYD